MSLLTIHQLDYHLGAERLLEAVNLTFTPQERVAIIGRNGAGKSTLLKLLMGQLQPDHGEIRLATGVKIACLTQEVPQGTQGKVSEVILQGAGEVGKSLAKLASVSDGDELTQLHQDIEAQSGWLILPRLEELLTRLDLDGEAQFDQLSGGVKRRVLLAQALLSSPDILLLDEPTNHLDIEAITWLENFFLQWRGCLIFITHDRRFLRTLATRIIEIDRGSVTSWPEDWTNYLRRKEERLHAEQLENARFDKFLAEEEKWIRQGIKARRTRNEGRVRRLKALREELTERRNQIGNVRLQLEGEMSGKKVFEAKSVSFYHQGHTTPIIQNFSATIMRGDKVGIIGANGSGKSTLLKLLLGTYVPQTGTIEQGTQLQIAYFDQYREQLNENWTAAENVAEGSDFVEIGGKKRHVIGYLQDFLFTPERARAPITRLSGGERNRLLLARLFARPANVLIMDEPTNDIDVETSELLEELLAEYTGTLLLISHDRDFLDQVVTSTLVMEGDGKIGEYIGGYTDWQLQYQDKTTKSDAIKSTHKTSVSAQETETRSATNRQKMSYKEKREWENLPAEIERLEQAIAEITQQMGEADFYQQEATAIQTVIKNMEGLQQALDNAYERWMTLEAKQTES